ncbi:cob(I)yrinic acid a,c-diamide adenosyltransferase [Bordetella pertussis]|uniref:cob(I)yrinic acid a,c-diamide adenosyltransferase n=1 Tax=Bordetella pertussis TaxID=520 RepID=UPI0039B75E1E
MANRLSVIATRTGDDGSTGLGDGSRVGKDTARIAALGDVDELNSVLGLLRAETLPAEMDADLSTIQHDLFDMGAELCIPGHIALADEQVAHLDARLAHYNAGLAPLREFILPGGSRAAALCHLGRTVARRAERSVVALARAEVVNAPVRQYLNRLSDLLFVLARHVNQAQGARDVYWASRHARPAGRLVVKIQ